MGFCVVNDSARYDASDDKLWMWVETLLTTTDGRIWIVEWADGDTYMASDVPMWHWMESMDIWRQRMATTGASTA